MDSHLLAVSFHDQERELLSRSKRAPDLWAADQYQMGPVRNLAAQQELSLPVMRLSHPQTIPILQSVEKLSSTKPVPGAKKVGDHSYKALMSLWGRHPPDFTLFQPLAFLLLHQHTFLAGFGHFYVLVLFYSESSSFRQPQWGCGQ